MNATKSARQKARSKITGSIPRGLFEEFDRFVNSNGYVKERAIAGALRLFMDAGDADRKAAILNNESSPDSN